MARRREIERRCEMLRELTHDKKYNEAWDLISELAPEDMDSVMDLKLMAEVQEKTGHYEEMKATYLYLFNSTKIRRHLKDYIEVLIRIGEFGDAKVYLKEFEKMDGAVADDFELRFSMAEALGASTDEKIKLLEDFKKEEYMESWGKMLAEAYQTVGREEDYKREMADLHLWFGGARILPDEEEKVDPATTQVVKETSENLAARLEAESEIVTAINEHVGEEVSRIVEQSAGVQEPEKSSSPTLDDMLKQTGRTKIEQLEVEPVQPTESLQLDPDQYTPEPPIVGYTGPVQQPVYAEPEQSEYVDTPAYNTDEVYTTEDPYADSSAPIIEGVGTPHTASGEEYVEDARGGFEAKYLNRRGQAETVGTPVKTDDPSKARRIEKMFAVDDNYEEGPEDVSGRGIRYWTPRDVIAKLRRRDYEPPHFVLAGGEDKMTLTMTKRISKELTRLGYSTAQKVIRITAERMNELRLIDQIDRILGRCLLVTEAAELTRESVDQLMQVMHEFGEEFVVVLSAPFDEIDCFLQIYPDLSDLLGYKVRMVY
ncbi:MAG: hypothetical protein J5819_02285 [Eubacterium sp.]|nr:hypothetical protein [Eubacterium sp.]